MKKQITISLIIFLSILSSCGTKKQITKSKLENNIRTQINSLLNTTAEIDDSVGITINEQIEETTTDTSKHQTTKRIINRRTDITKARNTLTKQTEETHKVIQEQNKEDNQTTTTRQYPIRKYLSIILIMIVILLIYKFTRNGK